MISMIPQGSHCPKNVALKALDTVRTIEDKGYNPKGLVNRFGWGNLTVYRSSIGIRKLKLNDTDDVIIPNGIIYRKTKTLGTGDWYILKVWWQNADNDLTLRTYAIGDCGTVVLIDLHEV